jgi:tetratricopeptide (TPR) repeat protein
MVSPTKDPHWRSRVRAFLQRTIGPAAAGVAAGIAVLSGWITNSAIRIVTLVAAVVLGVYLFSKSQRKEEQAVPEDSGTKVPPAQATGAALINRLADGERRRLTSSRILETAASLMVAIRELRAARARRRIRLRPDMLPPRLTKFQGREKDLAWLHDRHDRLYRRNRRIRRVGRIQRLMHLKLTNREQGTRRPLMLFIYGRPGVGKSAVAHELAQDLRQIYPHGQLYMNMGVAGGRRSERDILRVFLKALGWPEEELRDADAEHLGKVFRAVTARRRLLVVLDAARDTGQIDAVLPGGDRSAVIVTSRANLAGPERRARKLDTPSSADAARILRAYLTSDADLPSDVELPSAELIAKATYLCGCQPIALRAVGDRARAARRGLAGVVDALRDSEARLTQLAYGDRDVAERIASEYDRLGRRNKEALQALALIGAPTFVPWVLQPLLDITLPEAANRMAALSEVCLLDELGTDPAGFPRYGFSPLIRLFALRELNRSVRSRGPEAEVLEKAQQRFRQATVTLAKRVGTRLRPGMASGGEPDIPGYWIPMMITNWDLRVMKNANYWVRNEFINLIDAVSEAYDAEFYEIAWNLAAQLDDCDVAHRFSTEVQDAFRKARDAARRSADQKALAGVLVAEGSCLIAGERFIEAISTLTNAVQAADILNAKEISARASLLIGQAELRLGLYGSALEHLKAAVRDAAGNGLTNPEVSGEFDKVQLAKMLMAEIELITDPPKEKKSYKLESPLNHDHACFTEYLLAARRARRENKFHICQDAMRKASEAIYNDDTLALQLKYEEIYCSLECSRLTTRKRTDLIAEAAYLIVVSAEEDAKVSTAETRVLLARALLVDRQTEKCLETLAKLTLGEIPASQMPWLHAQYLHLQGEAYFNSGRLTEAETALITAVCQFEEMGEVWGQAESRLVLGRVQLKMGRRTDAQLSLLSAISLFERCGDAYNIQRALSLLAPSAALLAARTVGATLRYMSRRH